MQININKKYFTAAILLAIIISSTTSCKKFVENGVPVTSLTEDKVFVDSSTATSAVLSLYSQLANSNPQNNTTLLNISRSGSMSADEVYYLTNSSYDVFKNNTLAAGNDAYNIWFDLYRNIGRSNYCIAGLTASTTLSITYKSQLLGEAKFMRAWCYFYLINYYGDVPLVLSTDALTTALLPRSPVATVYQQIVADLTDAKALLTNAYPSIDKARVNQRVTSAMLARVYFYQQNWAAAETEATSVITSGVYSLETNFSNVFIKTSNETIWQISNVTGVTSMGPEAVPASTTPGLVLYDTLAKTFETGDLRKTNWTKSIVYSGITYLYPFKYKLRTGTTGNEYPVTIRLAEMYLTRAEARAQQNNISGAQADLNAIRTRAGLANTTATTQAQLLTALEHERWVELFTENGDRWFNLKRTGKADVVLPLIKPLWKPFQKLYPIPQTDRQSNPNLTDNTGY